jgi:transposase
MGFPRGMRRDRVALERRRLQAARLLEQGLTEAEVARRLGVHRQSVNRWAKALKVEGRAGLHRAQRAGRPPKLNEAEMAQLEQCLKQGPEQFGYLSGLWTLARVAKLIEQQHGVRYDASQVWRILRKLNWSCQRPTGRARERDESAIQQWKKVRWPQLKKKRSARAARSSSSTKAD